MADASQTGEQRLVLIDLSHLFWSFWHSTADQQLSEAYQRTVAAVDAMLSLGDLVAVCVDCPPYHRRELSASYKAQRAEAPPLALEQFERTKQRLRGDGYLLWGATGFEADDVIAWAVTQAAADPGISRVVIASNDKDLCQLVGDGVSCYSPLSRSFVGREAVIEKHGVPPEQMRDYLSLIGDSSDNVPGIPGVGPKNASALLHAFGSLEAVLAEAAKPEGESEIKKPAIKRALIDHADAARLAAKIITLRTDVPLQWSDLRMERQTETIIDATTDEPAPEQGNGHAPPTTASGNGSSLAISEPEPTAPMSPAAPEWSLGLEPTTLMGAHKLAQYLVKSRLYSRFPNAEALWAVIIRGREMGLGALESLDQFHVIEGRPSPSAHLLIGRAMQHRDCEYFVMLSSDGQHAEYETKRRGSPKPTKLRYTIEDAKLAGVVKDGSNWTKRPAEMLRKSAAVQLARAVYPEALGGAYSFEEMEASR
jgi:5'-3' exonuclease